MGALAAMLGIDFLVAIGPKAVKLPMVPPRAEELCCTSPPRRRL